MKQFIEDILHQQVEIRGYQDIKTLPPVFNGMYHLFEVNINGQICLLAEPKEEICLVSLRKHQRRIEQLTKLYCVFYFKKMSSYKRDKMIEEGISFILENSQIYMPFLGVLLKQNETRELRLCTQISFLTQKMLLIALYDQWQNVTVTEAARLLGVTKMSITRCYDEIESLEIPVLYKKGRTRLLSSNPDKKKMWNTIKEYLRDPLIREFYLKKNLSHELTESGMSALAEYSMLNDNEYKTYAIIKTQLSDYDIRREQQVPKGEIPNCIVQELGYIIQYMGNKVIDPLTVLLLMEKEKEDPRVGQAIEQMLEEYVW